ncbi:hypothetical protein [Kineosporia sp. A_224]|uniref:hypothetical protein n=1 Tax=Kineosporia sp. A_224 TaxID=1962180 RepID=UPI000B4BB696|nr:hypothetical protein [Kineosporia sp. A_224]
MSAPRTVIGLVVATGLLVGGGVAAGTLAATGALASSASPSAQPSAATTRSPGVPGQPGDGDRQGHHRRDARGGGGPGGLGALGAGRMLHGEVVVETAGGGTETLLVQRGTVTAKTADGVTVRSSDGFTTTWKVTAATQVRAGRPGPGRDGASGTLADVAQGAEVLVAGPRPTSGDPTARTLGVRPAGQRDGLGRRGGTATPSPAATASGAALQG